MKNLKWIIAICFSAILLSACSKPDDITTVKFVIDSNTPETPVRIYGPGFGTPTIMKGHLENEVKIEDSFVVLHAWCDDKNTLVTLEVYVKEKLEKRVFGNGFITTGEVKVK